MEDNQVSRTSLGAAFMRGYHALYDNPKIFDDPLAYSLLTEEERSVIARRLIEMFQSIDPSGAARVRMRRAHWDGCCNSGRALLRFSAAPGMPSKPLLRL